jgi:hypothetical protein
MKAQAARGRDIDDLKLLGGIIGIDSSKAALQVCAPTSSPRSSYQPELPRCWPNCSTELPNWTNRESRRPRCAQPHRRFPRRALA